MNGPSGDAVQDLGPMRRCMCVGCRKRAASCQVGEYSGIPARKWLACIHGWTGIAQWRGAPLRLRVENQLGYKMVKWIERIEFMESEKLVGKRQSHSAVSRLDRVPQIGQRVARVRRRDPLATPAETHRMWAEPEIPGSLCGALSNLQARELLRAPEILHQTIVRGSALSQVLHPFPTAPA